MTVWNGISRYAALSHLDGQVNGIPQVNNLAHYVLVLRLLPLMKRTVQIAPPTTVRIVMQSSEMHRVAPSSTKFLSKEEINQDGDGSQL